MESAIRNVENEDQLHNLFKSREAEILEEAQNMAKEMAQREMKLFEFELFFSLIPKNKLKRIYKDVNDVKKELWKEALKKANGDEKKAMLIYDDM